MTFEGKVAVVTGGSSGIGRGVAQELARQGARVIITGRDTTKLTSAAKELGAKVSAITSDATKVADIEHLFDTVRRDYGHIDILVANAGGTVPAPIGKLTEEHVDATLGVNLKGVIFTVQSALPLMRSGGSVVIIGSTASFNPPVGMSVYGAAKAGVRTLVKAWIQEIKGSGIRINLVSPGPIRTPGLDNFFPAAEADAAYEAIAQKGFVGRVGHPADIANAVTFLCNDAAGYINGTELFVDGGTSQI